MLVYLITYGCHRDRIAIEALCGGGVSMHA